MRRLLERLRLIDYMSTSMEVDQRDFVEKLKNNVDEGETGMMSSAFEAFSRSKNEYKGIITEDSFKLRRRRKLFQMNSNLAVAEGRFRQEGKDLIIEVVIKGFHAIFLPFFILAVLFYVVFIVVLMAEGADGLVIGIVIPFVMVHAALMLGIPYVMMRAGVARMKYNLERDLYFMATRSRSTRPGGRQ